MGRRRRPLFTGFLGTLKDKVSLSKAALLSKPDTSLAVLRATTHEPPTPASEKHVAAILSFGQSSRIIASSCVAALMDRLRLTQSPIVALKCLIAIHNIVRHGTFILQDQLSFYPSSGGRNYLNLSNFHDASTPESWHLSSWVRWYARAVEQVLFTSRIVGFFLSSPSSPDDDTIKEAEEEKVTAFSNWDLLKEIDSLVGVVEEISKAPDYAVVKGNRVVAEVMRLIGEDNMITQKEILIRLLEMRERLDCLPLSESVELLRVMQRLENCKRLLLFLTVDEKMKAGDVLMGLVKEMKEKIGVEERGSLVVGRWHRSESARLGERVVARSVDSVRFSSGRMEAWVDSQCC